MKNWLKKCSVALLVFSMIGTTMPGICGGCASCRRTNDESQQTEGQASEPQADESQQQEEQPAEKEQTTEEQQSVSENNQGEVVQEQEEAAEQEDQTEQSKMNYAYVESHIWKLRYTENRCILGQGR